MANVVVAAAGILIAVGAALRMRSGNSTGYKSLGKYCTRTAVCVSGDGMRCNTLRQLSSPVRVWTPADIHVYNALSLRRLPRAPHVF